jgi:hypothetical protein
MPHALAKCNRARSIIEVLEILKVEAGEKE